MFGIGGRIPIPVEELMSLTNMFYAAPRTRTPLHKVNNNFLDLDEN